MRGVDKEIVLYTYSRILVIKRDEGLKGQCG